MLMTELRDALHIVDGAFTLSAATFDSPKLTELLNASYNGQSIVISDATAGPGDSDGQMVIQGRAPFLNVNNLPVLARLSLDDHGQISVTLDYAVLDALPGPNAWTFASSFPDLPPSIDVSVSPSDPQQSALTGLYLSDGHLIVSTEPYTHPDFGVTLEPGISFVGHMAPPGALGIFANLFQETQRLTLYGAINLPRPTDITAPLPPFTLPYDLPRPPGINLKADLGITAPIGGARLQNLTFHIYSPSSSAWLIQNLDYQPVMALTGELYAPSADITARLSALLQPGSDEVLLAGLFSGITLAKLTSLIDLAGGDDMASALPTQLVEAGDTLGQLELEALSVALVVDEKNYHIAAVSFTIGMPELNWRAIPGQIEVASIAARFAVMSPFSATSRSLSVALLGALRIADAPLSMIATAPRFSIYASLEEAQTLPLTRLFAQYLPAVPPPADLTVNSLSVYAQPGVDYNIFVALANDPPWVVDVGYDNLVISRVGLTLSSSSAGGVSGSFSGMISFAEDVQLAARYDIPGDFLIRGNLPSITLSQLIARLCDQTIALPTGFDITLVESSTLIQKQGVNGKFLLATEVEGLGTLAFEALKQGTWGFGIGLALSVGRISQIPGLGALSVFDDAFRLEKLLLIVASFPATDFQFPDLAAFNNPRISATSIALPGQASGLQAGLSLYAALQLGGSREQDMLRQFLDIPVDARLGIVVQIGPNPIQNTKLFTTVSAVINNTITIDGQLGALLQGSEFGLFLTGRARATLQSQPLEFVVTLLLVANGAFLSGTALGTVQFGPLQLSNLALEIGINFEGIPSIGIAATLTVERFNSALAVFFDSANPSQSMLAGTLSALTLYDIVDTLAGGAADAPAELLDVLKMIGIKGTQSFTIPAALADALDNLQIDQIAAAFQQYGRLSIPSSQQQVLLVVATRGTAWYLTDQLTMQHYALVKSGDQIGVTLEAQLYLAPQDTFVGAIRFAQGFRVNGALDLFGIEAALTVEVMPQRGIAADAAITPIVVYRPEFVQITGHDGQGGPLLSLATFVQEAQPTPELRPPHLFLSGAVALLGVTGVDILVSVSQRGLHFDLKGELVLGTRFELFADFNSPQNFVGGGSATVGITGPLDLGPLGRLDLDLNTAVNGWLTLGYANATAIADFAGGFEYQGQHYSIDSFGLDIDAAPLAHLDQILGDKIKALFSGLLSDAQRWLDWVRRGLISGIDTADQVAGVLRDTFGTPADEAAALMKAAGYGAGAIAGALNTAYGASAETAASILKGLGYATSEVGDALKQGFGMTDEALTPILRALHIDTWTVPPVNTITPRVDTWTIPRVDTSTPAVTTWAVPHVDTTTPRVDFWAVPHGDTATPHIDTHADFGFINRHTDTGQAHIDTPQAGHTDTGGHIDTPASGHIDTPAVHTDTPANGHVDTGGHVDTPGVGHVDTP